MKIKSRYFCLALFLLLIQNNVSADTTNDVGAEETNYQEPQAATGEEKMQILASPVFSDTLGPYVIMTQGTASSRTIQGLINLGTYSDTNCLTLLNHPTSITTSPFTFTDNQRIYFGQQALSKVSGDNQSVQCIRIGLLDNPGSPGAFAEFQLRNLTCDGIVCTGGNVCVMGNPIQWNVVEPTITC